MSMMTRWKGLQPSVRGLAMLESLNGVRLARYYDRIIPSFDQLKSSGPPRNIFSISVSQVEAYFYFQYTWPEFFNYPW
jgi:hypothetical protein